MKAPTQVTKGSAREITHDAACALLERTLRGPIRGQILDEAQRAGSFGKAMLHLRAAMGVHVFPTAAAPLDLRRVVDTLDTRARANGLHVLQSWDFQTHRFADHIAPVLMLDYCARTGVPIHDERSALAALLDQYFVSLMSLLAVNGWAEGDANANLDRVTGLLRELRGSGGSGRRFVDGAETLLMLAISHYHPEETAYDRLLDRVVRLDDAHRLGVALACAATMSGHLRWGFRFMYRRDVGLMRDDNIADYPWLLFSLVTLMRAYLGIRESGMHGVGRAGIVEGLLSGLAADPWAFAGQPPSAWRGKPDYAELRDGLDRCRTELLSELEAFRPTPASYSPLGFTCNFLTNAFTGAIAIALADSTQHPSIDGLLMRAPENESTAAGAERYARILAGWASARAAASGSGGPALIVYDPFDAAHVFNTTVRTLGAIQGTADTSALSP